MSGPALRTAIVGCGRISDIHVAAVTALPDVEIVAVCDVRHDAAAQLAARHGVPAAFDDMESMMREAAPDVVHIVTPPRPHLALAEIAARHGAHMYVEKPLSCTLAEAEAIVAAATTAGVRVCAGHSRVFDPVFQEAMRRLAAGEIGSLVSVGVQQGYAPDPGAHGAAIAWDHTYDWGIYDNLMPHPLSLLCHVLRQPGAPAVVGANPGVLREAAVEEIRVLIAAENAVGELSLSLASPEVNRLELVGTRGRIMADFNSFTVIGSTENGLPGAVNRLGGNIATALKLATAAGGVLSGRIKRYMGIRALIGAFYDAVRTGAPTPIAPGDALMCVRLMEDIRRACGPVAKRRASVAPARQSAGDARILVTGATGYLGAALLERLSARECPVRATTRLVSRARALPCVEWVQCDVTREDDLDAAVAGIDTIYHCAAMVGAPGSSADYERANVDGTLGLARAAARAGVTTLVYISSLAVYGAPASPDLACDECSAYEPRPGDRGLYTQTKLRAEQAILDYAANETRLRIVVLRPGTIYGPGAELPVGLLVLPSTHRRPIIAGPRRAPVALTHVDNLVDAMLTAARSAAPSGRTYNVVDHDSVSQGEVCRALDELSCGAVRPVVMPYLAVWTMMLGIDLVSLARTGRLGTARYRLRRTLAPMRFPCVAARTELDWTPRVSLLAGLRQSLNGGRIPSASHSPPVQAVAMHQPPTTSDG